MFCFERDCVLRMDEGGEVEGRGWVRYVPPDVEVEDCLFFSHLSKVALLPWAERLRDYEQAQAG